MLADLDVPEPPGTDVGHLVVVGPSNRTVVLTCIDGTAYPGRGRVVTRDVFDDALRHAALGAGAVPVEGRAGVPVWSDADLDGFKVDGGDTFQADFVIGADGATSHVAHVAGLVEESKVLWGFAVRTYVDQHVEHPVIALWEQSRWQAFPGYGWLFPSPGDGANLGVGDRDPRRSARGDTGGAGTPRLRGSSGARRAAGPGDGKTALPSTRWLVEDGDGWHGACRRKGAFGGRCRRSRQPAAR